MDNFWDGFEKRSWNLEDARKAYAAVVKSKLVRRGVAPGGGTQFGKLRPGSYEGPVSIPKFPGVPQNLEGRIYQKGPSTDFFERKVFAHGSKQAPAPAPAPVTAPRELKTRGAPVRVPTGRKKSFLPMGASTAREGKKTKGKVMPPSPPPLPSPIKDMGPEQKELFNRTVLQHEGNESRYTKKALKPESMFASHASPQVIFDESNQLATLPKGYEPVRESFQRGRNLTGESASMSGMFPNFAYGQTRLSRHARRHMTDIYEQKQKKYIAERLSAATALAQERVKDIGKGPKRMGASKFRRHVDVNNPHIEFDPANPRDSGLALIAKTRDAEEMLSESRFEQRRARFNRVQEKRKAEGATLRPGNAGKSEEGPLLTRRARMDQRSAERGEARKARMDQRSAERAAETGPERKARIAKRRAERGIVKVKKIRD